MVRSCSATRRSRPSRCACVDRSADSSLALQAEAERPGGLSKDVREGWVRLGGVALRHLAELY